MSIGSDRVVVGFFSVGIRLRFRRNSSESDEIRVGSGQISWGSVEFGRNPSRIPTERNPTTTLSELIGFLWKMSDSDEIRRGSDRFRLDLQVGLDLLGIS
jgi:hypothetical protein